MKEKISKKAILISKLRMAGYHQDNSELTRIRLDYRGRMKWEDMKSHFIDGIQMRKNGVPCNCSECRAK